MKARPAPPLLRRLPALLLMAATCLCAAAQQRPMLRAYGYLKQMTSITTDANGNWMGDNLLHHRLNLQLILDSSFTAGLELRHRVVMGSSPWQDPRFAESLDPMGMAHPLALRQQALGVAWHLYPDRAWVQYARGPWELRAGRQRIHWGMNQVWNPLDWFNTWAYFDFDYEERQGSDALRLTRHVGASARMDAAAKWAQDPRQRAAAAKWSWAMRQMVMQVQAGTLGSSLALGAGLSTPVGNWALRSEAAAFLPLSAQDSMALTGTVSMERTLGSKGTFIASALWNGDSPLRLRDGNPEWLQVGPRNLSPLRATVMARGSYAPSARLTLALASFVGPADGTLLLVPEVQVSLSDRWDLLLLSQTAWADLGQGYQGVRQAHFLRLKWSY